MKKTVLILALCAVCAGAQAQSMGFLNVNPDAAASGMAGASVATKADAYAFSNNTAAAAISENRMAVAGGYGLWQPNATKNGILSLEGFYRIGGKFALTAGFKSFGGQEYTITSAEGRSNGTFTPKEMDFGLGVAYAVSENFSVGANFKMASSSLAEEAKASTFGADISAAYRSGALGAGIALCNLGGKVNYGGEDYSLPTVVKAGAAYEAIAGLTASAEVDYMFSGAFMAALGAEYWIKDIVAVRAGYHYGPADKGIPSYASVGLGAKFSGVTLNASYLLASQTLGGSLAFGVGYCF